MLLLLVSMHACIHQHTQTSSSTALCREEKEDKEFTSFIVLGLEDAPTM